MGALATIARRRASLRTGRGYLVVLWLRFYLVTGRLRAMYALSLPGHGSSDIYARRNGMSKLQIFRRNRSQQADNMFLVALWRDLCRVVSGSCRVLR